MQEYGEAALIFALTSPMGSVNISHVEMKREVNMEWYSRG